MEKMLVTQALNELKTLDSRINSTIIHANFVVASKLCEKNAFPGKTKEDFSNEAKASMQSIDDLIKRRETIKAAIIQSNAVTEIEVAGEKMTVAKAIDYKNSLEYKRLLLNRMRQQYRDALQNVNNGNADMQKKIDQMILSAYGKDGKDKVDKSTYDCIADPYKKNNEYGLVDPIGIEEQIKKLETWIDDFSSNVDAQLQISNCITFIEIG